MGATENQILGAFKTLRNQRGVSIVYCRGATEVPLVAVWGRTAAETTDTSGLKVQTFVRDCCIIASELLMESAVTLPMRGDKVRETIGGVSTFHEVLPIGNSREYDFSDPYQLILRIHTKPI